MHISMQVNRKEKKRKRKEPTPFFCTKYALIKPDTHLESKLYESKYQIVIGYTQARSFLYSLIFQT